jgi:LDH2 family malate/lactate/ureidoglycolate dehydrogenase
MNVCHFFYITKLNKIRKKHTFDPNYSRVLGIEDKMQEAPPTPTIWLPSTTDG